MLSTTDKNKLIDKINTVFATIGKGNGTRMPTSQDNQEPVAWELFVAKHLDSLAGKRKDAAEKAAVRAEVIVDKETNPQPEGTKTVEYTGENVQVLLSVKTGATRVDASKVHAYLLSKGVDKGLLDDAITHATTKNRPAHEFSAFLLTE